MRKRKMNQFEMGIAARIIGYKGLGHKQTEYVCYMAPRNELTTPSYGEEYLALWEMQRKGAVTRTGNFGNRIRWALTEYGISQVKAWYGLSDIFINPPAEGEDG